MTKVLEGVRVLEVALYGFVPAAASVLAEQRKKRYLQINGYL